MKNDFLLFMMKTWEIKKMMEHFGGKKTKSREMQVIGHECFNGLREILTKMMIIKI